MATPKKIIWQPQPKQALALVRTEFEILYGGARGGGKTDAGMAWMLYEKDNPSFRGLVIRLNAKDLADWVDRARKMYRGTGCDFVGSPVEIRFPSGAKIRTGHLKDENAYGQYQGHEYQKILIEELTQIPDEKNYELLISSCRSTVEDIQPQIFCTTNPGNLGHDWVKHRWNISGIPTEIIETATEFGNRAFIPSTVYDNPKLTRIDPNYIKQLENISDLNLRKAWLHGDWDNPVIEGSIYKTELEDAYNQGRVGNFPHDPRHPVYTYWDIGIGNATVILFMQFINGAWKLIDSYGAIDQGLSHFRQVLDARGYYYGNHYGPHDLAKRQMGVQAESILSIAENLGIIFTVMPRRPVQEGIVATKEKFSQLFINEEKNKRFLEAAKGYRREYDEEKKMFKDTPLHDWTSDWMDALRQWAQAQDPVPYSQMNDNWNLYNHEYK